MIAVKNASEDLPKLGVVDDYYVNLSGNHFQQDKTNVFNIYNNVVTNIYCLYVLIMSRTRFRVNPRSIVA